MPRTGTVIAGLVYAGGVLIGADSQSSDPNPQDFLSGVKWDVEKLRQVPDQPLVVGFSGNTGFGDRIFTGLTEHRWHASAFGTRLGLQRILDGIYGPEYQEARRRNAPPTPQWPSVLVHSLSATWAAGRPGLLEQEPNGDSSWHDTFQTVGSGKQTAHAVYRALGGPDLCRLKEPTAIAALLRILQTAVDVEMTWVGGPIHLWRVDASGATKYPEVELDGHRQTVAEWLARDRDALFKADAGTAQT